MIFCCLEKSNADGELILLDGGYCRFHIRRDGILKIYEIISQKPGRGREMLEILKEYGLPIKAKCPKELVSNGWYAYMGFEIVSIDEKFNTWVLKVKN